MYGYLTFAKDIGLQMHTPTWQYHHAVDAKELAQRQAFVNRFIDKECAGDTDKQRKQIIDDLGYIVPHVKEGELNLALFICRAHNLLPDAKRKKRLDAIDTIIQDQFGDIKAPTAELVGMLAALKRMGILMPDAFQKNILRSLATAIRAPLVATLPEYKPLLMFLSELGKLAENPKAGEEMKKRTMKLIGRAGSIVLSRPTGEFAYLKTLLPQAFKDKHKKYVLLAEDKLMALSGLHDSEILDALLSVIRELVAGEDKPEDIVNAQLEFAMAEHESQVNQAFRVTIAAFDAGLKIGRDFTASSVQALADYRAVAARIAGAMAAARKKAAPPGKVQKNADATSSEQEDMDPAWSWSIERLARWIEGPIVEPKQLVINRKMIVQGEKTALQQKVKAKNEKPVLAVTAQEVGDVIQDAFAATARFFLDQIHEMLPVAQALKAAEERRAACEKMKEPLQLLSAKSGAFNEVEARGKLVAAEAAIQSLRKALKTAKTSALVERRFPGQLSLALGKESMVLGKRNGGVIACPVSLDDWSYVADTFHNCWVPRITRISVGEDTLQLDQDQAVALYVTGSSLSGYAFDVSVHLWRRRAKRRSQPSNEGGLFPRMNENDWFDTYVPCCVLHVPRAAHASGALKE